MGRKKTGKISAVLLALILTIITVMSLVITGSAGQTDDMQNESVTRNLFAMDTYMTLTAFGENAAAALDIAEEEIISLDKLLSTGNSDSEIHKLNEAGSGRLSDVSAYLLKRSLEANAITDGAFNPLIYPLMEEWGFTDDDHHVPDQDVIDSLLTLLDVSEIDFDEQTGDISFGLDGMKIDFGGIAKGYTSSRIMDIFSENGVSSAVISLGGNVQVLGTKTDGSLWRVAIRDPEDASGYIGILETGDKAVITSGGYERFFEEDGIVYHHIIDPATGYPASNGLISVTIVSSDGTLADALSTAVYVAGLESGTDIWRENADKFEMILMTDNKDVYVTEGIADHFSSSAYDINVITRN